MLKRISLSILFFFIAQVAFPIIQSDVSAKENVPQEKSENYKDINNHWAKAPIEQLIGRGLVTGREQGGTLVVDPDSQITRAETITVLMRSMFSQQQLELLLAENDSTAFTDSSKNWAHKYIELANSLNIASGYPDGTFRPNKNITRAELIALLVRAYHLSEEKQLTKPDSVLFKDVPANHWARKAIITASLLNIVKGYNGNFKPNDNATRAESFVMVLRGLEWMEARNEKQEQNNGELQSELANYAADMNLKVKGTLPVEREGSVDIYIDGPYLSYISDVKWTATVGQLKSGDNVKSVSWAATKDIVNKAVIRASITLKKNDQTLTLDKSIDVFVKAELSLNVGSNITNEQPALTTDDYELMIPEAARELDSDGDGILDYYEINVFHSNPFSADTDGDGLPDGYEADLEHQDIMNILLADTDGDGISDADEDLDSDGLTNIEEYRANTNPFFYDTDGDLLSDGDEIHKYGTDPLLYDSDQDGLDDGSEVLKFDLFHTSPTNPDTNGNGILDGDEQVEQIYTSFDAGIDLQSGLTFSLKMDASGDMSKTTTVTLDSFAAEAIGTDGAVGNPIDIVTASEFENPVLEFHYDKSQLNNIQADDLRVFYFNPETQTLELVPDQTIDTSSQTVSAQLEHFSTYVLGDMKLWASTWSSDVRPIDTESDLHAKPFDIVFVIDSSSTMDNNDPLGYRKQAVTDLTQYRLLADDAIGIVDLDSYSSLIQPLLNIGTDKAATNKKFETVLKRIDSYGGTNIYDGMVTALNELELSSQRRNLSQGETVHTDKHMILLTDWNSHGQYGPHSANYQPEAQFHSELMKRAIDNGVKIDTFLLNASNSVQDRDKEVLYAIAQATGGTYSTLAENNVLEFVDHSYEESNKDTDGDGIPDQFEVMPCYIKGTMGKYWDPTNPNEADTDGDGLNDYEESGTHYYSPETGKVYCSFDVIYEHEVESIETNKLVSADGLPTILKSASQPAQPYKYGKSDPNKADSDNDGDPDNIDDKPRVAFKAPIVMIHGICSNSRTAWGADTYLKNYRTNSDVRTGNFANCYSYGKPNGATGSFTQDIQYKALQSSPQAGVAYKSGTEIGLSQLDAQFIRKTPKKTEFLDLGLTHDGSKDSVYPDTFANYLNTRGMEANKDYFVFNWDAGNHVEYGANQLEGYLKAVQNTYDKVKLQSRDITRYNRSGNLQTAHFQLIGHSAGGLVSRMYIENLLSEVKPQIDTLITIDTPHWGSNGHYASGTQIGNPGACDSNLGPIVFADLDQDDSPLWYSSNEVSLDNCGDNLSYNLTKAGKPELTKYIFISSLVADGSWKSLAPDPAIFKNGPLIYRVSYERNITGSQFHQKIQSLVSQKVAVPNDGACLKRALGACIDSFSYGNVGEFGDYDVNVLSQFGIPSSKQAKKGRQPVEFDEGYLFVGTEDQVQHTHIEHQTSVMNKVYELIKR